jgi:hypothetical protein
MRALAIIAYAVATLLGAIALVFGGWGIAMTGVYILLFGIAFQRIAMLQRHFSISTTPSSRPAGPLPIALFSFALLAVVAALVTRHPELLLISIYLSLFGCLFCGLASLGATVRPSSDDTPAYPTEDLTRR